MPTLRSPWYPELRLTSSKNSRVCKWLPELWYQHCWPSLVGHSPSSLNSQEYHWVFRWCQPTSCPDKAMLLTPWCKSWDTDILPILYTHQQVVYCHHITDLSLIFPCKTRDKSRKTISVHTFTSKYHHQKWESHEISCKSFFLLFLQCPHMKSTELFLWYHLLNHLILNFSHYIE